MSRVLVTGITGLVGQSLSRSLAAANHEVIGICRGVPAEPLPASLLRVDLAGQWTRQELPERVDAVVHLAQADGWQSIDGALDVFAVNLASTLRLLDYAAKAGATHFVLASSGGLYGPSDAPLTESSPLRLGDGPLRCYFETKRSAENFAEIYQDRMAVAILRPFFIYGTGQRVPKLVPRLIETLKRGDAVRIKGDTGSLLNPVHVDDVVRVIEACVADAYRGVVNVAGGQATSIRAMSDRIANLLGVSATFQQEAGAVESFVADTSLMNRLIGRAPIGFDDGIRSVLS